VNNSFYSHLKENNLSITTSVEYLDKQKAAQILASMNGNRPISENWVKQLAGAMKRGEWKLNGEPIIISASGRGLDGQHRCAAVVRSDSTVPMLVVRGVDESTFVTMGQGKRRSFADVLGIEGFKNCAVLAAIARGIMEVEQWQAGGGGRGVYTNNQLNECLGKHPLAVKWAAKLANKSVKTFTPSVVGSVLTLAEELHGPIADSFFDKYETGSMLERQSPILALREKLMSRGRGVNIKSQAAATYAVKCWNAYLLGKKIGALKWSDGEQFPIIK